MADLCIEFCLAGIIFPNLNFIVFLNVLIILRPAEGSRVTDKGSWIGNQLLNEKMQSIPGICNFHDCKQTWKFL